MGKRTVDDASLTLVANEIRAKTGGTESLVFPQGFQQGVNEVYNAGFEAGQDDFWAKYQKRGAREDYWAGFGGYGWHTKTFFPRYDIRPTNAKEMFWYFGQMIAPHVDLVDRLKNCGVTLDFSRCTNFINTFAYSHISRVGIIDTTACDTLTKIFSNSNLKVVDKLILKSDGGQSFSNAFYSANRLESIKITGKITVGIDLGDCVSLSKASIKSFFAALGSNAYKTITLSKESVDKAFETGSGTNDGSDSAEWKSLVATKPTWTVNLI